MEPERIPPQDLLAERAIISGMVQSEEIYYKAIMILNESHFYSPSHKKAFIVLRDKKGCKNMYVLEKALEEDDTLTIDDFLGISYTVHGEEEIKSIIDNYQRRETIINCENALNAAYNDKESLATDIMSKLTSNVSQLISGSSNTTVKAGSMLGGEFERIEKVQKNGSYAFIKTGIGPLDKAISISQDSVVVIGARPSNCKSTLANLISRNIALSGGRSLVFYLDTSKERELSRTLFAEAKVNLHQCNTGMLPKRDYPKLSLAAGPLAEAELYFDDSPKLTPLKAAAICNKIIHEKGPLSIVVFDFIQNMKPNYPIRDIRERISHISEELHDLPKEIKCPIVVLSQMARYMQEDRNPPQLNNLKESGDIEEDADIVLLLYYPWKYPYHRENNPDKRNLLEAFVAKYKDGPVGYVPLTFIPETLTISGRINEEENNF